MWVRICGHACLGAPAGAAAIGVRAEAESWNDGDKTNSAGRGAGVGSLATNGRTRHEWRNPAATK